MAERRVGVRVSVTGTSDEFRDMARDATTAAAAVRAIPNTVRVRTDTSGLDKLERQAIKAHRSSSLLLDSVAMLAPTIAPLSAVAVAGLGGVANQAAVAGMALGTTMLALSGVGEGVKALEQARLEPTAENLQAAREALAAMPRDAAAFTRYLHGLRPVLDQLQASAANGGFLRGSMDGIDALLTRLPQVNAIIRELSSAQGILARSAGESLAGPEFDAFFEMLERTAKPTLLDLGRTLGSLAKTGANLWTAFEPLNRGFSSGLADMARSMERWSATTDFSGFIEYVQRSTPLVLDTLGSLANLFTEIVKAGAPLGGPTLRAISLIADALAQVAASPAGPVLLGAAAGFAALNRAMVVQTKLRDQMAGGLIFGRGAASADSQVAGLGRVEAGMARTRGGLRQFRADVGTMASTWATAGARTQREAARMADASSRVRSTAAGVGKAGAGVAALGFAFSGAAEKTGLANTTMLGLAGTMAGPWGAAAGASLGLLMDLRAGWGGLEDVMRSVNVAAKNSDLAGLSRSAATLRREAADMGKVTGFKDFFGDAKTNYGAIFSGELTGVQKMKDKAAEARSEFESLRSAVVQVGQAMGKDIGANSSLRELNQVMRESGPAMRDLGISWGELKDMGMVSRFMATEAIADWKRNADLATDSTEEFTTAVAHMDRVLTRRAGVREARQALMDAGEAAKGSKRLLDEYGRGLQGMGRRGIEAEAALDGFAAASVKAAQGMSGLRGKRYLEGQAQEFIRTARAMGMSTEAAVRLAARMRLIPRNQISRVTVETRAAEARVRAIQRLVDRYGMTRAQARALLNDAASGKIRNVQQLANRFGLSRPRAQALLNDMASGKLDGVLALLRKADGYRAHSSTTHTITTVRIERVQRMLDRSTGFHLNAAGGLYVNGVERFAGGGAWRRDPYDRPNAHPPHIAKAGTWRVFGEEETGGEAYIPLANDWRRPRARSIAAETVRMLGGQIQWNAQGALRAPSRQIVVAAPTPADPMTLVGTLDTPWGPAEVRGIARQEAEGVIADHRDMDDMAYRAGA